VVEQYRVGGDAVVGEIVRHMFGDVKSAAVAMAEVIEVEE